MQSGSVGDLSHNSLSSVSVTVGGRPCTSDPRTAARVIRPVSPRWSDVISRSGLADTPRTLSWMGDRYVDEKA